MIEAFLACALAVSPPFVGQKDWHVMAMAGAENQEEKRERFLTELLISQQFLNYSAQRFGRTSGRVLVVDGGDVSIVNRLRMHGLRVFGLLTSRANEITHWHTIGAAGAMPYQAKSFYVAYWLNPVRADEPYRDTLLDIISVIERGGFLAFYPETAHRWEELLELFGWEQLPFSVHRLSIWQKPPLPNDNPFRRSA